MNSNNSILILEDEFFVSDHIHDVIKNLGYNPVGPFDNAEEFLENTDWKFDAALLDIFLAGTLTGLDVATQLSSRNIPFIFLTANQDSSTLAKAAQLKPQGYIAKPFKDFDVKAALQIIFSNQAPKIKVQGNYGVKELAAHEILFVKTDRNYLDIHTVNEVFHHRSSLKEMVSQLPDSFVQVNRFCVVNTDLIDQKTNSQLKIKDQIISISRNYRKNLE